MKLAGSMLYVSLVGCACWLLSTQATSLSGKAPQSQQPTSIPFHLGLLDTPIVRTEPFAQFEYDYIYPSLSQEVNSFIWTPEVRAHAFDDFLNGTFSGGSEYSLNAISLDTSVSIEPGSYTLRSFIDPYEPTPEHARHDAHFRAEVHRTPWHPTRMDDGRPIRKGYEHWLGWSYYFPEDYVWDYLHEHLIFQYHAGSRGPGLQIKIRTRDTVFGQPYNGEMIMQQRWGNDYRPTTARRASTYQLPKVEADQVYRFVLHVIANDSSGPALLELWVNGEKYASNTFPNLYDNVRHFPTPKWGFYSFRWRNAESVANSATAGVIDRKLFIGPIREIKRNPKDPNFGRNAYHYVKPQLPNLPFHDPSEELSCRIIPNPALYNARLMIEGDWEDSLQVEIWSLQDTILHSRQEFSKEQYVEYFPLPVSELSEGIYRLKVSAPDGESELLLMKESRL